MTNQFSFEGSQSIENKSIYPKFCENCGFYLVNLGTFCLSRKCAECGKEVFFIRQSEDGGVQIKEGEKFHFTKTFSLDPTTGGWFTREGLDQFIKQMFLGRKISSEQELVDIFKDIEKNIDNRLTNLDCISHCNLETEAGLKEAIKILEEKDLNGYKFDLFRSSLLRECYLAIEDGNALGAAYAAHQANLFKELSILEEPHLKEIIRLGYPCYLDFSNNEGMTEQAAKEKRLIKGVIKKIRGFDVEYLYALTNDGNEIAPRISVSGISENTLKALIDQELQRREKEREENLTKEEIDTKKQANSIKRWGTLFTLINGIILCLYNNLIPKILDILFP